MTGADGAREHLIDRGAVATIDSGQELLGPAWMTSLVGRSHREAVEEHAAILHAAQGLEDLGQPHATTRHLRREEAGIAVLAATRDAIGEIEDEEAARLAERPRG